MDHKDNSKKEKGFLSSAFGKAARKAVLGTLLVAGLMGGVSTQAMAQSAGNGIVPYQIAVQPWSGDQTYQVKLQNIEAQSALRLERLRADEQRREADANKWHTDQINRQINAGRDKRNKWDFTRMAGVGSQMADVEARYKQSIVDTRANYQSAVLREQENLINQINGLDNYYSRLPQYKGATYNTGGYKPTVQSNVSVQAPARDQALSPQQQHDRLVRAYQDAQLKAAQQGKPMPSPQSYGLNPRDPALGGG